MAERLPDIDTSKLVFDPDPFVPDFKEKMGRMVTDETQLFVKDATKNAAMMAAFTVPLATDIGINLDKPTALSLGSSMFWITEEIFETGHESTGAKMKAVAIKAIAGYTGLYATYQLINGTGNEGSTAFHSLVTASSAVALVSQTNLKQLAEGVKNVFGKLFATKERSDAFLKEITAKAAKSGGIGNAYNIFYNAGYKEDEIKSKLTGIGYRSHDIDAFFKSKKRL